MVSPYIRSNGINGSAWAPFASAKANGRFLPAK